MVNDEELVPIELKVAGRLYVLSVPPDRIEIFREAERRVAASVAAKRENLELNTTEKVLAMVALEGAILQIVNGGMAEELGEVEGRIHQIVGKVNVLLK